MDDRENAAERQAKCKGATYQPSVKKEMRWSHWTRFKAEEALSHLKKVVFPNLSKLADEDDSFGEYMKTAECKINKPSLLIEAYKLIDQMEISQQNQDLRQGDMYEYLLGHLSIAGRTSSPSRFAACGNGQLRTPRQEEIAGVVARVESLRGRMGESTRQVEGLIESLLAESFG